MSGQAPKVLAATLWQRTSGKGNEYLTGFLGKARIIGFRGEPTAEGTPTWDLYLQPGKEQEERAGGARGQQQQASSGVSPRPAKGQRYQRPEADSRPFDDDISGLWRGPER